MRGEVNAHNNLFCGHFQMYFSWPLVARGLQEILAITAAGFYTLIRSSAYSVAY